MTFLYKSEPVRGAIWQRMFTEQLPDLPFCIWPVTGDKDAVRYIGAWTLPDDLHQYTNLKVLFLVAAGVDQFDIARIPRARPTRKARPDRRHGRRPRQNPWTRQRLFLLRERATDWS